MISNWFPRRQQGSAVGWANAGTPLGGAIAGPIVGFIALAYGWRVSFVVIALIVIPVTYAQVASLLYHAPDYVSASQDLVARGAQDGTN